MGCLPVFCIFKYWSDSINGINTLIINYMNIWRYVLYVLRPKSVIYKYFEFYFGYSVVLQVVSVKYCSI